MPSVPTKAAVAQWLGRCIKTSCKHKRVMLPNSSLSISFRSYNHCRLSSAVSPFGNRSVSCKNKLVGCRFPGNMTMQRSGVRFSLAAITFWLRVLCMMVWRLWFRSLPEAILFGPERHHHFHPCPEARLDVQHAMSELDSK